MLDNQSTTRKRMWTFVQDFQCPPSGRFTHINFIFCDVIQLHDVDEGLGDLSLSARLTLSNTLTLDPTKLSCPSVHLQKQRRNNNDKRSAVFVWYLCEGLCFMNNQRLCVCCCLVTSQPTFFSPAHFRFSACFSLCFFFRLFVKKTATESPLPIMS